MVYNPKNKTFGIERDRLDMIYLCLRYALKSIREMAGLPLDKYKRDELGPADQLGPVDHAQRAIIEAAENIGIDMGGKWGNEIDLRD